MSLKIKNIWIEFEEKGPIINGITEIDDNSDVIVTMENGQRFVASFFTYKNIDSLRKKNSKTGECLSGKYFWASDMILIEKLNRTEIEKIIQHLIRTEEFESVFKISE